MQFANHEGNTMDYYCTNFQEGCSMAGRAVNINWHREDAPICRECGEPMMDYEQYHEDGFDTDYVIGDNRR